MPKVYVVAEIEVTDGGAYEDYKRLSTAAAERYGGRFLVRGGTVDVLEGEWQPHRFVILEFDDEAAARRWYDSPEYTEAKAIRRRASRSSLILVRG
ncbi:MAG TPA: DUF1330 domain-containing protein [Nocardioidaceae bacterium]|nr:DUF1330 domain-containing protein [Nocardioidaceae bacterium]